MNKVSLVKNPKTSAPGQYLGYSLQQVRFCKYLLTVHDGYSVGLEAYDDVSVHGPKGDILLEQAKSALTANPLANKADALWKTLATWATLCTDGTVDLQTAWFRLYVTPDHTGELAGAISSAADKQSAATCLTSIKKLFPKAASDTGGVNPHVHTFLSIGDDKCLFIIERMRIQTESDPIEPIRELLRATLNSEFIDDFAAAAIGMAHDEAEKLIRQGKPAIIEARGFRSRFQAFVRKHNLSNVLVPTMPPPDATQLSEVLLTEPLYIQQLRAVGASKELMLTAVSDVLMTRADKVGWAEAGSIVGSSLKELDDELVRHHTLTRDEVEDEHANRPDLVRGRMLYRRCIDLSRPLEGRPLPAHFIPGAFNCLADLHTIGWHPAYASMFQTAEL